MVAFNIIGHGFLDVSDPSGVAFKADNPFYRFADISLGRSTEFSVPGTDRNREMMGFGEDPAEYGEMLRRRFPSQMVYDGGAVDGTIVVTAFEGDAFKCVFMIGTAGWIDTFQKTKLQDIPMLNPASIVWQSASVTAADTTQLVQMVPYDRKTPTTADFTPCVNVRNFITNLLGPLGIGTGFAPGLENYWIVAASMVGGGVEDVTITTNAADNMSVTGDTYGYFSIVDTDIEWGTVRLWSNGVIGGGDFPARCLKATQAVKVTFPAGTPDCYLVQWSRKMTRYKKLAGPTLTGVTVEIPRDGIVFFAQYPPNWTGYRDTFHPFTQTVKVDPVEANMAPGDIWRLENNLPDMTLFEFLKAVAVGTGNDLVVTPTDVAIVQSEYGQAFAAGLDKVVSVDKVARWVDAWGSGTKTARVVFSSEDYVADPLSTEYTIDSDIADATKETKCAFSEGGIGNDGILIDDRDGITFTAKRWTLAYAEDGWKFLQRVEAPSLVSYDDIASEATCMQAKVAATIADFAELVNIYGYNRLLLWRGSSYVWTSANWSDGIMTLTLQRVSQPTV